MPKVDLPLDQRNIIITRSKEGILDIKKIFISKGANVFDFYHCWGTCCFA